MALFMMTTGDSYDGGYSLTILSLYANDEEMNVDDELQKLFYDAYLSTVDVNDEIEF